MEIDPSNVEITNKSCSNGKKYYKVAGAIVIFFKTYAVKLTILSLYFYPPDASNATNLYKNFGYFAIFTRIDIFKSVKKHRNYSVALRHLVTFPIKS